MMISLPEDVNTLFLFGETLRPLNGGVTSFVEFSLDLLIRSYGSGVDGNIDGLEEDVTRTVPART